MVEKAHIFIDGAETPVIIVGRNLWALRQLLEAGEIGCTPITRPAPRWSHYTWKLRGLGVAVETIHEPHGGAYPGNHARYVLRSEIRFADEARAA